MNNVDDDKNKEYAGFWIRAIATILDWIWLYGIIYALIFIVADKNILDSKGTAYLSFYLIMEWLIPAIVVLTFWSKVGATPGKILLKVKIVDAKTGIDASFIKLFVRYLAYFVSMLPLFLGFFWVGWDKKKQGFHDKIANTLVVKT